MITITTHYPMDTGHNGAGDSEGWGYLSQDGHGGGFLGGGTLHCFDDCAGATLAGAGHPECHGHGCGSSGGHSTSLATGV
jgi:hypothetical protein